MPPTSFVERLRVEGAGVVLPAAGLATRIGGIPKFLLPSRDGRSLITEHVEAASGAGTIVVVTRPNLGGFLEEHLAGRATVVSAVTETMSETVSIALEALPGAERIVVGLPDTAVRPWTPYADLVGGLEDSEVTVAAYPTRSDQAGRLGALRIDEERRVVEVRDKDPSAADWPHHWGAIGFRRSALSELLEVGDPHVGYALEAAARQGRVVRALHFGEEYFDLGTVEEVQRFWEVRSEGAV